MNAESVTRHTGATPADVWRVLADGWSYPSWVVGASRMRAVSAGFPAVGSKLHHSVGCWPALLDDHTEVLELDPGRRILLEAKGRPMGRAKVEIVLTAAGGGTDIVMREKASGGPARLIPTPIMQLAMKVRNDEALDRLVMLAERATDPETVET